MGRTAMAAGAKSTLQRPHQGEQTLSWLIARPMVAKTTSAVSSVDLTTESRQGIPQRGNGDSVRFCSGQRQIPLPAEWLLKGESRARQCIIKFVST